LSFLFALKLFPFADFARFSEGFVYMRAEVFFAHGVKEAGFSHCLQRLLVHVGENEAHILLFALFVQLLKCV